MSVGHVAAGLRPLYHTRPSSALHILGLPVSPHGDIPDSAALLCAALSMELQKVGQRECCQ